MAEKTGIGWTDATINFWHGCHKVSEGCRFCYMYRDKERWHKDGNIVLKTQPSTINGTLAKLVIQAKERAAIGLHEPLKIFTCSYSDFFIEEADHWRKEAWDIIRAYPEFTWQILTKRIDRAKDCFPEDWGDGWPHVWLGASMENQKRFDERFEILLNTPARTRFISGEPLLQNINMGKRLSKIDWVILGGESGNETGPWKYRKAEVEWFVDMTKQCNRAKVPVFVKQMGTDISNRFSLKSRTGEDLNEWGTVLNLPILQQQDFPR